MDKEQCGSQRTVSRMVGLIIIIVSLLLLGVGLMIIPVVGSLFAIPFLILGVVMIAAPDSKTCQLVLSRLGRNRPENKAG